MQFNTALAIKQLYSNVYVPVAVCFREKVISNLSINICIV